MFKLAHITDPHLGPLPPVRPAELMNKRFFGYLSWMRRRRGVHRPEVLAALAADLEGLAPDHLVVTGDLTNIALPEEFTRVGRWLEGLGAPEAVTVIPGNHDAYVAVPWEASPLQSGNPRGPGSGRDYTARRSEFNLHKAL